jgi:hypothetical protein
MYHIKGINFVTDENQNKIAVLIDLKKHKATWDDFYSILISESREDEPKRSYREFRNELVAKAKL